MIYKYKAISEKGQAIEGFYQAKEKEEVLNMLRANDYLPILIEIDVEAKKQISLFAPKVKKRDLAVFCRQFYTLVNSGVTIIKSFEILENQTRNKTLKRSISSIYEDIQKGYSISQAMKKQDKVFPNIFINMVEAGETSGTLDIILERITTHFEKESKLENKIKSAMIYPMLLIIISTIVIIFMLVAVLPTFVGMFSDSGISLPWATRFILYLSELLEKVWYLILGIGLIILLFFHYYKDTLEGRKIIDNFKISMPLVKITNIKIITSRFTRTLSILISSGIPLLEALEIAGRVLNNTVVQDRLMESIERISKGISLSQAIRDVEIFPTMVDSMISVGEESGSLDEILYKTADFYDEEVENSLQRVTTLVEPILLVGMAIVIGFIVIAMALPMFNMVNTIQ